MVNSVNEGDIVFVEVDAITGDGVIGRVTSYDEETQILVLEWPKGLSPYGSSNNQSFFDALKRTQILSKEEIFKTLLELRIKSIQRVKENYQQAAAKAANDELHI